MELSLDLFKIAEDRSAFVSRRNLRLFFTPAPPWLERRSRLDWLTLKQSCPLCKTGRKAVQTGRERPWMYWPDWVMSPPREQKGMKAEGGRRPGVGEIRWGGWLDSSLVTAEFME